MRAITTQSVLLDRLRAGSFGLLGTRLGKKVRIGPRCRLTRPAGVELGTRAYLEADVWLKLESAKAEVKIGEYTFIGRNVLVNAIERITIGAHTLLGPNCVVIDHNHGLAPNQRINEQPCLSKPVLIGNGVWCGCGVTILPGRTIGDGAVIGANAVVTHDIPGMAIAAGNPARILRMRNEAMREA